MNIKFSPPDITQAEIDEVVDALKSGWITTGPKTKALEKDLKNYLDADGVVCLNSQTACAEIALRLLGIKEGDEVITSSYTYTASASVIYHVGAKIVLIDTQKDSLEMDYCQLENAINEKTKAIIPVDIAGIPCDYDKIFEILERKKNLFAPNNELQKSIGRVAIVQDAAHALGATYKGKKIGSFSDFTAFSFHAVKNLTTAEGGALSFRKFDGFTSEDIYKQIQLISLHGQSKDALAKIKPGAWEYDIVGPWYKCNMTDIAAGMGLAQLRRYPEMLKRREEIVRKYNEGFKNLNVKLLPHVSNTYYSSWHLYLVRVNGVTVEMRNEIITKMAEAGVACNVHYKPLPMMTAYKNLGFDIANYPNAYNNYANEITLPLHTKLTDEEVGYIIDNFVKIVTKVRG